jgi:HEAT repeat protein
VLDKASTANLQAMLARIQMAGNDSLPMLEEALKVPSPELRRAVGAILQKIGTAEAASLLMRAVTEEKDPEVKKFLEACLAGWSDPRGAPAFVAALQVSRDPQTRDLLAKALGPMMTADVARSLLQDFARPGANADFRAGIGAAFAYSKSDAVSIELANFLNSTNDPAAIMHLADAVARIGDHAVVAALLEAYRRIGTNENFEYFMKAIGGVTNPASVPAFAESLSRHEDKTDAWRIAAVSLSNLGTPEAVDALLKEARFAPADSERRKVLLDNLSRV